MKPLRPYQARATEQIVEYACEHVSGRLLVVGPPGSGKTRVEAEVLRLMAVEQGMHGLAWAHRRELVHQLADELVENGIPEEMIGVTMAGDQRHRPGALVSVASVDTLRHRDKPPADVVVSDEAHRDASAGRSKLRALYPDAFHAGFTATPIGPSGQPLRGVYDEMLVIAQPSELVADGYLAAPRIYTVPPELLPDVRRVRRKGGDLDPAELERVSNRRALVGSIVEHWQRLAGGRRTLVYAVGVKHSKAIVARFLTAGIAAAHVDGNMLVRERDRILAALSKGELLVVSSCDALTEGLDIPPVKCVVFARASESLRLVIQQGGRCMRPWEGVEPIILDHAGNVLGRRHGAPHADRAWSLDDSARARSASAAVMKRCDGCGLVVAGGLRRCSCGEAFDMPAAEPEETPHSLQEYRPAFTAAQKEEGYERILMIARERCLSAEWIERVYQAKFGERRGVLP